MSRHRNVRSLNYSDECEGLDDVYGHSVEDDYSISPSVAEQFMYDRTRQSQMSAFFREEAGIAEEDEEACEESAEPSPKRPQLSDIDEARLQSCLDEIRNVVGDTAPERMLVDAILRCGFDIHRALDFVLNASADKKASTTSNEIPGAAQEKDDKFHLTDTVKFLTQRMSDMHVALQSSRHLRTKKNKTTNGSRENSVNNASTKPMSMNSNEDDSMGCDVNFEPTEGSLLSLMTKHQNSSEELPRDGSLFSLMAKHADENQTQPMPSLFSLMSQHENSGNKENATFSSFADLSAHYLQTTSSEHDSIGGQDNMKPIDLSCALVPPGSAEDNISEDMVPPKIATREISREFPSSIPLKESGIVADANFLPRKLSLVSKRPSELGHVLCRQWSTRFVPYINSTQKSCSVKRFQFNTPSPDDVILNALKKPNDVLT